METQVTLAEIAAQLSEASRRLSQADRERAGELLWQKLNRPVGELERIK